MKKKPKQTQRVDDCECVYCGHVFDGTEACNYDMSARIIICPECKREMEVYLSIEYLCKPIEEDGDE